MKNNKGYTLVELLISIAIFAIAMVGIISMMSSTLKAYSNANIDVSVQEDAQIVANQIEELLCDSKSVSKSGDIYVCVSSERDKDLSDGSLYWKDNVEYDIQLAGNELKLTVKDPYDGSVTESVLAKNVKNFSIGSYGSETSVAAGQVLYNEATFNIEFDNHGSTYALSRNVYFRNHGENKNFNSIEYLKESSGGGSVVSKDEKLLNVKRYAEYNLTSNAEYNIKYFKKNASNENIYFYKKTGESTYEADNTGSGFFDISEIDNFPHKGDTTDATKDFSKARTYVLKANSTVEGNWGNPLGLNEVYVVGYKDEALSDKVVIKLNVDAVACHYTVVQVHGSGSVNAEPLLSPIEIDGLDVDAAVASGKTATCSLELGGKSFPDTVTLKKYNGEIKFKGKDSNPSDFTSCGQWSGGQMNLGVFTDPFNGGIYIGIDNQGAQYGGVKEKINNDDKLKVTLTVDGKAVSCPDLGFDILGSGL